MASSTTFISVCNAHYLTRARTRSTGLRCDPILPTKVPAKRFALAAKLHSRDLPSDRYALNDPACLADLLVCSRISAWIKTMVVGLGLCPFAEGVVNDNSVRSVISHATSEQDLIHSVSEEIDFIIQADPAQVSTTLLVYPDFSPDDFLRFHDVCSSIDESVEHNELLVDQIMLAHFHPAHQWADASHEHDPINFDKRSPYPVINILRAPQVDQYIEEGKTQNIVDRNRRTLERLGPDRVQQLFRSL